MQSAPCPQDACKALRHYSGAPRTSPKRSICPPLKKGTTALGAYGPKTKCKPIYSLPLELSWRVLYTTDWRDLRQKNGEREKRLAVLWDWANPIPLLVGWPGRLRACRVWLSPIPLVGGAAIAQSQEGPTMTGRFLSAFHRDRVGRKPQGGGAAPIRKGRRRRL